jgi:hypothetical protein
MRGRSAQSTLIASGETRAVYARVSPADLGDDDGPVRPRVVAQAAGAR